LINNPPKAKVLKHLAETTHKIPFISRQKEKKRNQQQQQQKKCIGF
jgi:hypothetical protein